MPFAATASARTAAFGFGLNAVRLPAASIAAIRVRENVWPEWSDTCVKVPARYTQPFGATTIAFTRPLVCQPASGVAEIVVADAGGADAIAQAATASSETTMRVRRPAMGMYTARRISRRFS